MCERPDWVLVSVTLPLSLTACGDCFQMAIRLSMYSWWLARPPPPASNSVSTMVAAIRYRCYTQQHSGQTDNGTDGHLDRKFIVSYYPQEARRKDIYLSSHLAPHIYANIGLANIHQGIITNCSTYLSQHRTGQYSSRYHHELLHLSTGERDLGYANSFTAIDSSCPSNYGKMSGKV